MARIFFSFIVFSQTMKWSITASWVGKPEVISSSVPLGLISEFSPRRFLSLISPLWCSAFFSTLINLEKFAQANLIHFTFQVYRTQNLHIQQIKTFAFVWSCLFLTGEFHSVVFFLLLIFCLLSLISFWLVYNPATTFTSWLFTLFLLSSCSWKLCYNNINAGNVGLQAGKPQEGAKRCWIIV